MVHSGSHAPRPKKNRDTLHNETWLRSRYVDQRLSATAIARELGCSAASVYWALRKFGISVRTNAEAHIGQPSVEWTPEMRESLARKRRGKANPFHGRVSEHRGPNWHPDIRIRNLRTVRAHRRGMTGIEYDAMFEAQGGVCAICGRAERKISKSGHPFTLAVDHNHATGAIRALLCNDCNACLGMLREDITTLRSMIAYLERHQT